MELKYLKYMVLLAMVLNVLFATTTSGTAQIQNAVCSLVNTVKTIIPAVAFLLIVLAAIVYAAGQIMGAETRARATVWATAMLTGAIIGLVIYAIAPGIIELLGGYSQGTLSSYCQ